MNAWNPQGNENEGRRPSAWKTLALSFAAGLALTLATGLGALQ